MPRNVIPFFPFQTFAIAASPTLLEQKRKRRFPLFLSSLLRVVAGKASDRRKPGEGFPPLRDRATQRLPGMRTPNSLLRHERTIEPVFFFSRGRFRAIMSVEMSLPLSFLCVREPWTIVAATRAFSCLLLRVQRGKRRRCKAGGMPSDAFPSLPPQDRRPARPPREPVEPAAPPSFSPFPRSVEKRKGKGLTFSPTRQLAPRVEMGPPPPAGNYEA